MDRFELEGTAYYQQGRKCGKPACHCRDGELHGPYWWARPPIGKVRYIGKELPNEIARARRARDRLGPEIARERRDLQHQVEVLRRLLENRALIGDDQATIRALGFGDALVYGDGQPGTQD